MPEDPRTDIVTANCTIRCRFLFDILNFKFETSDLSDCELRLIDALTDIRVKILYRFEFAQVDTFGMPGLLCSLQHFDSPFAVAVLFNIGPVAGRGGGGKN